MFLRIALVFSLALMTCKAVASYIYADNFSVGQHVGQLTKNVSLHWIDTGQVTDHVVIDNPDSTYFFNSHFGGELTPYTYGGWDSIPFFMGSPLPPANFAALEIDFKVPTYHFGYKVESHGGEYFSLFLLDAQGIPLDVHVTSWSGSSAFTRYDAPPSYPDTLIYTRIANMNFDVGVSKIVISANQAAGYIYALDIGESVIDVVEPASIQLLLLGVLALYGVRRLKLNTSLLNI